MDRTVERIRMNFQDQCKTAILLWGFIASPVLYFAKQRETILGQGGCGMFCFGGYYSCSAGNCGSCPISVTSTVEGDGLEGTSYSFRVLKIKELHAAKPELSASTLDFQERRGSLRCTVTPM